MKFRSSFLLVLMLLVARSTIAADDPAAELASFSAFDKIDINDLAKSDVETVHGPPMGGRFLSVQSCYVVPGSPDKQMAALKNWDPTKHRELKVLLHFDLPNSPTPANFSRLRSLPDNGVVRTFVSATEKLSDELQISKDEAQKFRGTEGMAAIAEPWSEILAARAKSFVTGGTAAQPSSDHTGKSIRPNEELNSLLKQLGKIRKQFAGFLSETGIGRGAGSLKPDLYWEFLNVDDHGVVTLGASYSNLARNFQAADVLYYASGGYYVALTLYQMWPVTADGKPATLVWRGDMISAASLEDLHGVERLGSESAMMKDISKAVTLFRNDTSAR
jgi:hypothetical protein